MKFMHNAWLQKISIPTPIEGLLEKTSGKRDARAKMLKGKCESLKESEKGEGDSSSNH